MEKIPELTYLKRIAIVMLVLFACLLLMNLLEVLLWLGVIYSGYSFDFSDNLMLFLKYEDRASFYVNSSTYILQIVFLLIANRFVKNWRGEKGFHFLIVLLAFVPVVNYFLRFIVWRKCNRSVFDYSGVEWRKSDRKIKTIWVLTLISETFRLIFPFLVPFFYYYLTVVEVGKLSIGINFTREIVQLLICIIYLGYYLEFKRALDKSVPPVSFSDSLLDA